jgi:hypothetical protein
MRARPRASRGRRRGCRRLLLAALEEAPAADHGGRRAANLVADPLAREADLARLLPPDQTGALPKPGGGGSCSLPLGGAFPITEAGRIRDSVLHSTEKGG